MANILIYGDSNTHGTAPLEVLGGFTRHPKGSRWPDVVAAALPDHEVIAEGLPGRTTVHDDPVEGGNRNGLSVLPAIVLSHVPLDLVVIMLGTNDLKPRFGVTAFEIARSAERLVREVQGLVPGVPVALVSPVPIREAGVLVDVFDGAEARQAGLERQMEAAAARCGVAFIEGGRLAEVSPVDGVHWAPEAHVAFGQAMAPMLDKLLKD
mgnify:CR=1 FL=1